MTEVYKRYRLPDDKRMAFVIPYKHGSIQTDSVVPNRFSLSGNETLMQAIQGKKDEQPKKVERDLYEDSDY